MSLPQNHLQANDTTMSAPNPPTTTSLVVYSNTFPPSSPVYTEVEWSIVERPIAFLEDGLATKNMAGIQTTRIVWPRPAIQSLAGFSALPDELQIKIIQSALPAPRIIKIYHTSRRRYPTRCNPFPIQSAGHCILGGKVDFRDFITISTKFEQIVWESYKRIDLRQSIPSEYISRGMTHDSYSRPPGVLVDLSRDTVILELWYRPNDSAFLEYLDWMDLHGLQNLAIAFDYDIFDVPYDTAISHQFGSLTPWEVAVKFTKLSTLTVIVGDVSTNLQGFCSRTRDCRLFEIDNQLQDMVAMDGEYSPDEPWYNGQPPQQKLDRLLRIASKIREDFYQAIDSQPALHPLKKVELKVALVTYVDIPSLRPMQTSRVNVVPKKPVYHGVKFEVSMPAQTDDRPCCVRFEELGSAAVARADGTLITILDFLDDIRYLWD